MWPRWPESSPVMSPILVVGRGDLDVDDRLEHDRPRLAERVEERLAAGGDERDLLGVDRVVLAVVDDDAHVLQRVAGEEAAPPARRARLSRPPG